jgi:hypothetical protein
MFLENIGIQTHYEKENRMNFPILVFFVVRGSQNQLKEMHILDMPLVQEEHSMFLQNLGRMVRKHSHFTYSQ